MNATTLAINGGQPVRGKPMPPRLAIGPAERSMMNQVLDYYADRGLDPGYQGHFEERYCAAFSQMMGGGFADVVATGTAALYVALAALDLPKASEVLVSPITDPGTFSAIILNGLVPRLVDSQGDTYNIALEQVRERFTEKVSCILVVHSIGRAVEIEPIVAFAREKGVRVLEDCSQSHGSMRNGRRVGSFGDIAAFSTMYRKASICGPSSGVVYSTDRALYHRALACADRGKPRWQSDFDDRNPGTYLFPALNLHSDEISCGIGLASLGRLDETRRKRLAFVKEVARLVSEQSSTCYPYEMNDDDSPFVFPILIRANYLGVSKIKFAEAILKEGIDLSTHYNYLAADWPWLGSHLSDKYNTPNARRVLGHSFNLYLNENYTAQEAQDVVAALVKVETCLKK